MKILKHVNLIEEAYHLLKLIANVEDINELKKERLYLFSATKESYEYKFAILAEIYETVKRQLKLDKEKIAYYFKERKTKETLEGNSTAPSYVDFVLLQDKHHLMIDEAIKRSECVDEEEKYQGYAKIIYNDLSVQVQSEEEVIKALEKSYYTDEYCWQIIKILHHQQEYQKEVIEMIQETVKLLERHKEKIHNLEVLFNKTWEPYNKDNLFVEWICKKTGVTWDGAGKEVVILPSLFFMGIGISSNETATDRILIRCNISMDDQMEFKLKEISSDQIVKFGKVMADKSKVEILKFISDNEAYGKEIADSLQLKAATISYHMAALIELCIVKTTIKANKVYYLMDKKEMKKHLEALENYWEI